MYKLAKLPKLTREIFYYFRVEQILFRCRNNNRSKKAFFNCKRAINKYDKIRQKNNMNMTEEGDHQEITTSI